MKPDFSITADQEVMASAVNYNNMLFGFIKPHMHGDVLEVGSGIGNFTERVVAQEKVRSVTCYEVDADCAEAFRRRMGTLAGGEKAHLREEDFTQTGPSELFDAAFSFNVLEHIKDDRHAVALMVNALKPGAPLILYLPALQVLYGTMDRELMHHRRYDKAMLRRLFEGLPVRMEELRYLNALQAVGWFVTGRILKRTTQPAGTVRVYDTYLFPLLSALERRLSVPFGANIVSVVRRT